MPLDIPNLDDRDFQELMQEVIARIPVHTPEWNNFNDSDPGMTFVQLFAFMMENLLYRSNRIPQANRLKFLTLLGIGLQPATPGRGLVQFLNERGPIQPIKFPEGGEVRAGNVPFRTLRDVVMLPVSTAVYYKMPRTDLDPALQQRYKQLYAPFVAVDDSNLSYYQTTPLDAPRIGQTLPEVDLADESQTMDQSLWIALVAPKNVDLDLVRAAIAGQTLSMGIYPSVRSEGVRVEPMSTEPERVDDPGLIFEIAAPDPDAPGMLKPTNYKRLDIDYAENVLDRPGIVQITLPPAENITLWNFDPVEEGTGDYPPRVEDRDLVQRIVTWIRIRLVSNEQTDAYHQAKIAWIGGNVAQVLQAIPISNEIAGVGNGAPFQTYTIANTPIILDRALVPGTSAVDDSLVLEVETSSNGTTQWVRWLRTDDISTASERDKVFMVNPESGQVIFSYPAAFPALGAQIRVSYEYGGGTEGKLTIGQLTKSPILPGGIKVNNPVPTWGASSGETLQEGERNISQYVRHHDRLVTMTDFEDITLRTPGIDLGRVEVLSLFHPDKFNRSNPGEQFPGMVTVMVLPQQSIDIRTPPVPDKLLLNAVCRWLDPRRLVTTELYIRGAEFINVWVTIGIEPMPGTVSSLVYKEVREAIREYLSPLVGGVPTPDDNGEFIGTGWPLGMEVRRQDLEAVAVRVDGVRYVRDIQLGVKNSAGNLVSVTEQKMFGLELPWLVGVEADRHAAPLDGFTGTSNPDVDAIPIPVIPKKC